MIVKLSRDQLIRNATFVSSAYRAADFGIDSCLSQLKLYLHQREPEARDNATLVPDQSRGKEFDSELPGLQLDDGLR